MMQKEPDDSSRIVIVEVDSQVIGILVDSVAEVVNIRASKIETAPNLGEDHDSSRYIQGVYSEDDQILILVDMNKLLTEQELDAVSGF